MYFLHTYFYSISFYVLSQQKHTKPIFLELYSKLKPK